MTTSRKTEFARGGSAAVGEGSRPLLKAESIHAGYGKKEVLHGVDLEVRAGEIVVLAGANGAGKSTFLKVVAGLLKPTAGRVWFEGHDVTHLPSHDRRRRGIGFLLQGGEVFPSLTVEENLAVAIGNGGGGFNGFEPPLNLFPSLREKLHQRAGLLSGGERQMLALAMVLSQRPRLLLLDEPTAALAPSIASETLHKVSEFCQGCGIGVVLVEQRLREALSFADRALPLVFGRIDLETRNPHQWAESIDLRSCSLPNPNDRQESSDSGKRRLDKKCTGEIA